MLISSSNKDAGGAAEPARAKTGSVALKSSASSLEVQKQSAIDEQQRQIEMQ